MLDCGIHPGFTGLQSLPYFDEVDLSSVDVALITHFHLDHCAAVPYLVGHTNFKGRLLMTHPTKAIYHTLLRDFVKVSRGSVDEQLYNEADLEASMAKIEVIDFQQTLDIDGIKVTAHRAGHVLGAAMFMVEVAGMRCLYTGDYSRVADRHLAPADIPPVPPHIVIVESTYGVSRHLPREERERRFLDKIHRTVAAGGRVLLPVVALGRAQELLLLLEEYWERTPELRGVPVYTASGLARKALTVYQTYIEMMNDDIKAAFQLRNPFQFRYVSHLRSASAFDDSGPCVVLATPSMLQSGLSRELFEAWCEDERNALIIADFAVQGTLAREVLGQPGTITTRVGLKVPLRMSVEAISFSAHADYEQTREFLNTLAPPHVVLVHGEAGEMARLKAALEREAVTLGLVRHLYTPRVTQSVQIEHRPEHEATLKGRLAEKAPVAGAALRGVLVRAPGGGGDAVLHPSDLPEYTRLHTGGVLQRQALILDKPLAELRLALEVAFEGVEGHGAVPVRGSTAPAHAKADGAEAVKHEGGGAASSCPAAQVLDIGGVVSVTYHPPAAEEPGARPHVVVEWRGGSVGDTAADAVIAVILQVAGEPVAAARADAARRRAVAEGDVEGAAAAELQLAAALMRSQFGPTEVDAERQLLHVNVDNEMVLVDYAVGKVHGAAPRLQQRLEKALSRLAEAMRPTSLDFDD